MMKDPKLLDNSELKTQYMLCLTSIEKKKPGNPARKMLVIYKDSLLQEITRRGIIE